MPAEAGTNLSLLKHKLLFLNGLLLPTHAHLLLEWFRRQTWLATWMDDLTPKFALKEQVRSMSIGISILDTGNVDNCHRNV